MMLVGSIAGICRYWRTGKCLTSTLSVYAQQFSDHAVKPFAHHGQAKYLAWQERFHLASVSLNHGGSGGPQAIGLATLQPSITAQ